MTFRLKQIYSLAALLFLIPFISNAIAFTPTAEQIDTFKRLPPSQQKALAQQHGINLDQLNFGSNPTQPNLQEPIIDTPTPKQSATPEVKPNETNAKKENPTKLEPFGYDLFSGQPDSFSPVSDIPPPDSYVIGPSDNLVVQLYGKENSSYSLTVNREGQVQFPEIGPITLAGLTFTDARALLMDTVQQQMIGVKASITMGTLRSIRIFVLGEALYPGSYTVSSLSTMTNALFTSGGVSEIGSLRNIQLKRRGKLITTLDLYDLLLNGDTSKDARLLPGDVIFIPPIGATVGVSGEVKRPAIYELKYRNKAADVIKLAGGFKPTAYPSASKIKRINTRGERTLVNIDLNSNKGRSTKVTDADIIQVYSVLESMENIVMLEGHAERPGGFAWKKGMRVNDVIHSADELLPYPDLNIALIEREAERTREKSILTFNLGNALADKNSTDNLKLNPRDKLHVFNYSDSRAEYLKELVQQLKLQASKQLRKQTVTISGHVRFPGEYPLSQGMTGKQAVLLAGGLTEKAYGLRSEITRVTYNEQEEQQIQHISIDLASAAATALAEEDQLHIKRLPNWLDQEVVTIEGEVKFPGEYKIKRGETLAELVARAGGLNEWAYPEAAVFTREELKALEAQRLKELRSKLEAEIAATNIEQQSAEQKVAVEDAEELLQSLNEVRPLGRMVIDLTSTLENKNTPIELKSGDKLRIPRKKQAVTVVGEVQFPTSHMYDSKLDVKQYIEQSGGATPKADNARIYVVKANGRVFLPESSSWFTANNHNIQPGDTVVVPLDADRIKPLTLWTSVSQVFYQIALGAAAVASF